MKWSQATETDKTRPEKQLWIHTKFSDIPQLKVCQCYKQHNRLDKELIIRQITNTSSTQETKDYQLFAPSDFQMDTDFYTEQEEDAKMI